MAFFNSAVTTLQTIVVGLGGALCVWGGINLLEGYGQDMLLDFVQDENHSILVSSHITSDLEKIADYIVFLHEGRVVFSKPKDELTEQYGIIKCGAAQFDALDKSEIIAYRKMDYEWQVLVADRNKMQKKYPKAMIVPASIDEIMLLYVKGEAA